jgi:hypothetical protein
MDSIRESAPKVVQNDVKWNRKAMDSIRESAPEVVQNDVEWKPGIDGYYSGERSESGPKWRQMETGNRWILFGIALRAFQLGLRSCVGAKRGA